MLKELREAFAYNDLAHDNTIETKKMGTVMRQAGLYPTEAELEEMKRQIGAKGKVVDYETFMGYIHRNY